MLLFANKNISCRRRPAQCMSKHCAVSLQTVKR